MKTIQRLDHIDSLRGLAVLGVIGVHTSYYSKPFYNAINALVSQGASGVQLFYVISAFTLFLSWSMRKEAPSVAKRNFFIRRFFRIAPLFYCTLIFYLLRDGMGPREFLNHAPAITPLNILATMTFTNGFNPYWINSIIPGGWSVAVEMLFYLFVPFAYSRIKSLYSASVFTFVSLLISIVIFQIGSQHILIPNQTLWSLFLFFWPPNQIPVFGLGFMLFFIYRHIEPSIAEFKEKKAVATLLLAVAAYLCIALAFGGFKFIPTHFLYGIAFVLLTIALALVPFKILVNKWTIYLGKISYSAYLTHFALLPFAKSVMDNFANNAGKGIPVEALYLMTLCLVLVGTVLLSTLTYRFIEQPGQNLGRRLIATLDAQRVRKSTPSNDAAI